MSPEQARLINAAEEGTLTSEDILGLCGQEDKSRAKKIIVAASAFVHQQHDAKVKVDHGAWQAAAETACARGDSTLALRVRNVADGAGYRVDLIQALVVGFVRGHFHLFDTFLSHGYLGTYMTAKEFNRLVVASVKFSGSENNDFTLTYGSTI